VSQSPAGCCFHVDGDAASDGEREGEGIWGAGHSLSRTSMWVVKDLGRGFVGKDLDYPLPADINGERENDPPLPFDPLSQWRTIGVTWVYFGGVTDIQVTRKAKS